MNLRSEIFRKGLLGALAGSLLLGSTAAGLAQDCEPLSPVVGPPPSGLVSYQLPDLSGIDVLGRDGSRVRADTNAPAPTVTRFSAEAPQPSSHWAVLADLSVYNDAKGRDVYWLSSGTGELRLCRIEHREGDEGTAERFEYRAGRLTGWQWLVREQGAWRVSEHRCFNYDAEGRLTGYASASRVANCGNPKPADYQEYYLRGEAGKLTHVIELNRKQEGRRSDTAVALFDGQGTATQFVAQDQDGDPLQFPIIADKLDILELPGRYIKLKARKFQIAITDDDIIEANSPWEIVLGDAEATSDDYLTQFAHVRLFAKGTTDEKGRVHLSAAQQGELWDFINAQAGRTCLMFYSHCIPIVAPYPADEWARCIDPGQRDPAACRAH